MRAIVDSVWQSMFRSGLILLILFCQQCLAKEDKPNILLILTDDQGFGDIRSHGNKAINTPVMDRLANSGVRFDRFYVSPVCAPTRAALLTGRYARRTGVHGVTRARETMRAEEVTIAEILKENGYKTGCFGKWHNGAHYPQNPIGQGFDTFTGFCAGHWNNYFNTTLEKNGKTIKTNGYITDVLTDEALAFIEDARQQPFFAYVAYNAPHSPFQVPDRYFNRYKKEGLSDELACVYGMCENLDDNIGRLLKKLDALKLSNKTMVIFITDNGPNTKRYNAYMRGRKAMTHEGGVRVPCFVSWPGTIQPGRTIHQLSAHIDILPTIADLAGLKLPAAISIDGQSLAPLIFGNTNNWPDRIIFSNWRKKGGVRTKQHRLHIDPAGKVTLFDMRVDPSQKIDISPKFPQITDSLKNAYAAWLQSVNQQGFSPVATEIGHDLAPLVVLSAHEATLLPKNSNGISYYERNGWANDWICRWSDLNSYGQWPVRIITDGEYEIAIDYVCPPENVGAKFKISVGDASLEGEIAEAWDPDYLPSPDRVERGEVYEKIWKTRRLGKMSLKQGDSYLKIKAIERPGIYMMDVKAVRIKKVKS